MTKFVGDAAVGRNLHKIVEIGQEKCDGGGTTLLACHEGAVKIMDGKSRQISDELCDGQGDCLSECPRGAIVMIGRKADLFSQTSV